jgi:hypothetical protein
MWTVPCDDAAVHLLQNLALAWDGARAPGGQIRVQMPPLAREILLRSLGEARTFPVRGSRPLARRMAATLGIPAPPSAPVPYLQAAEAFTRDHGWPVALTREGVTAGDRVRICANAAELREAYAALTHEDPPGNGLRRLSRYVYWSLATGFHLAGDLTRPLQDGPLLAIEAHAAGRAASYSVVAHEGRWLGGLAAVSERTYPPGSGASSAVRMLLNAPTFVGWRRYRARSCRMADLPLSEITIFASGKSLTVFSSVHAKKLSRLNVGMQMVRSFTSYPPTARPRQDSAPPLSVAQASGCSRRAAAAGRTYGHRGSSECRS